MLLQTLVFVVTLTLVATALAEGSLAFARAATQRAAESYLTVGIARARAFAARTAADGVRASGPDAALTLAAMPAAAACDITTRCPFTVSATFVTVADTRAGTSGGAPVRSLEGAAGVHEQRVVVAATVAVAPIGGGPPAATRKFAVVVRTFGVTPYAAVSAVSDPSSRGAPAIPGDTAGCSPTLATQCDPAVTGALDDTRIAARAVCLEDPSHSNGGTCTGVPAQNTSTFTTPSWDPGSTSLWSR